MPPSIKICGITTGAALEATIKARAHHIGLVFHPKSPRHLTLAQAAALARQAASRIGRVGLFVDPTDEAIAQTLAAVPLDALQLHGGETPARAAELRARFALPVWKAIPVASAQDVANAQAYRNAADLILFDAKTPKGTLPGGMGLVFDWNLLHSFKPEGFPQGWGLAGGLTPANVAQAIRLTRAPLVDTSSGVESAPGVKDVDSIAAFAYAAGA